MKNCDDHLSISPKILFIYHTPVINSTKSCFHFSKVLGMELSYHTQCLNSTQTRSIAICFILQIFNVPDNCKWIHLPKAVVKKYGEELKLALCPILF